MGCPARIWTYDLFSVRIVTGIWTGSLRRFGSEGEPLIKLPEIWQPHAAVSLRPSKLMFSVSDICQPRGWCLPPAANRFEPVRTSHQLSAHAATSDQNSFAWFDRLEVEPRTPFRFEPNDRYDDKLACKPMQATNWQLKWKYKYPEFAILGIVQAGASWPYTVVEVIHKEVYRPP